MFGIPVYGAQCFMTMCVSALALTSLDSVDHNLADGVMLLDEKK